MSFHTELLESRRMLSASINDDGVLEVVGTSQKDVIVISVNADNAAKLDAVVNGEVSTCDVADITGGVSVRGLGGKDRIVVDEANGEVDLNCTLSGGNGKDDLAGGSGDDELDGGTGKDRLSGNAGDDVIRGGNGRDHLDGGFGDDYLVGGRGADALHGGAGDDDLDGGQGKDKLFGEGGNDDFAGWDSATERQDDAAGDDGDNGLGAQDDADPLDLLD